MLSLETSLKQHARRLGFESVGIARAEPADHFDAYRSWLDQGHAASMEYMGRHAEARRHPSSILANVRSIVMLGMHYESTPSESSAQVARYARGADYHKVLWKKLDQLLSWVQERVPDAQGRGVVDTAPLLERGFARRAGLGWFGKNTMLIARKQGSYFFLAALLLDIDLTPDEPFETQHCGTCTACLDACPTDAFSAPHQLDARRCISYLTIEHRGPIDPALREGIGSWLLGCDICQEVCPWNRAALATSETAFEPKPHLKTPEPLRWLNMTEEEYRTWFGGTALTRAKRTGLRRNAAIVLGNTAGAEAIGPLEIAATDEDPTVADAARWAIERIRDRAE